MNDFLRADSLASACACKSGFTREWELTGLTGILQQIIFPSSSPKQVNLGFQPPLWLRHSGVCCFNWEPCHGPDATRIAEQELPARSTLWASSAVCLQNPGALKLVFERRDLAAPSGGGIAMATRGPLPGSHSSWANFLWMLTLCPEILPWWIRASASNSTYTIYSLPDQMSQLSSGFLIHNMRCPIE